MPRDNYALMADATRKLFLTYDQSVIIRNIPLTADPEYLYLPVLDRTCRICRTTGTLCWSSPEGFVPSTEPGDPITVFDYLCDAKPGRTLSGRYRPISGFGNLFHTGLNENAPATPLERFIDTHPDRFRAVCEALGGTPDTMGDMGYTLPLFPDLPVLLRFWHSDEDFPPSLRIYWDENALSWLRYETMYYAWGLIRSRLSALLAKSS